jgi:hypothetical protein
MTSNLEEAVKRILGLPAYLDQDLSVYFTEDSPQSIARAMLITGLVVAEKLGDIDDNIVRASDKIRESLENLQRSVERLSDTWSQG